MAAKHLEATARNVHTAHGLPKHRKSIPKIPLLPYGTTANRDKTKSAHSTHVNRP